MGFEWAFVWSAAIAVFVFVDARRMRLAAEAADDPEAAILVQEPGLWAGATFVLGGLALPLYLWKTRGGVGAAVGVGLLILIGLVVVGFRAAPAR